jgi:predicted Rossmann-fold nucleotide-binding protein
MSLIVARAVTTTVRGMRVCVYCGSSSGRGRYLQVAASVGTALARRGFEIVYGGARVGTMGALADAALTAGGTVIGVIPRNLVDWEVAHTGLTELHVVDTMHERKAKMVELADLFRHRVSTTRTPRNPHSDRANVPLGVPECSTRGA